MILSKLKIILPTIIVGQTVALLVIALASSGAELGILIIGPLILLIGILIELVIIFIKVKDTLLAKIVYSLLGLILAIAFTITMGLIMNLYNHKDDRVKQQTEQAALDCYNKVKTMLVQTGQDKMQIHDPGFNQRRKLEQQFYDNCMSAKGFTTPLPPISLP